MKKQIILSFLLLLGTQLFSQEKIKNILNRVIEADYIFEGKVIRSDAYKSADTKHIYTSHTIEISRIAKGNLTCGTVELITDGGRVGDKRTDLSHTLKLNKGESGIFLTRQTGKELSSVDFFNESNYQKLEANFEEQSWIKYWYDGEKIKVTDYQFQVDSLIQLYNLAQFITGVNLVECQYNTLVSPVHGNDNLPIPNQPPLPKYEAAEYNSRVVQMQNNINQYSSGSRAASKLTVRFANSIITGQSPKYLEFDIVAKDNVDTSYFWQLPIYLKYGSASFGTWIVSGLNFEVTRGTVISDTLSYMEPYAFDNGPDTAAISLNSTSVPSNFFPLTENFTQLVHVKMELSGCDSGSVVKFDWQDQSAGIASYSPKADNSSNPLLSVYNELDMQDSIRVPDCKATTTTFEPHILAGGVEDTLKIHGFLFGNQRGNGTVFFKNANDFGASEVAADSLDFISWSDTLITLKVPAYSEKIQSGIPTGITQQPAGSGYFRVLTNSGEIDSSQTPIKILYSIRNDIVTYQGTTSKQHYTVTNASGNGGYKFKLDSRISAKPGMKEVVVKALHDWTCLTGIDWYIESDTTAWIDNYANDSINMIQFATLPNTVGAKAVAQGSICGNDVFTTEIDVLINSDSTINWSLDTTGTALDSTTQQRDFYAYMLHEFGHALSLKHVNNIASVMYFSDEHYYTNRTINIFTDSTCDLGGNRSMDFSLNAQYTGGCGATNVTIAADSICLSYLGIKHSTQSQISYSVFPNPATSSVELKVYAQPNTPISWNMYDINGQLLLQSDQTAKTNGIYSTTIDISNFTNGIYILMMNIEQTRVPIKLIKTQ